MFFFWDVWICSKVVYSLKVVEIVVGWKTGAKDGWRGKISYHLISSICFWKWCSSNSLNMGHKNQPLFEAGIQETFRLLPLAKPNNLSFCPFQEPTVPPGCPKIEGFAKTSPCAPGSAVQAPSGLRRAGLPATNAGPWRSWRFIFLLVYGGLIHISSMHHPYIIQLKGRKKTVEAPGFAPSQAQDPWIVQDLYTSSIWYANGQSRAS